MTQEERKAKIAEINSSDLSPQQKVLDLKKFIEEEQTAEEQAKAEQTKQEEQNAVKKVELMGAEIVTIKGEKGDKGDKGEQGEQGLQGEKGDTGADSTVPGPKGEKGDKGDPGRDGKDGIDGINGQDGKDGADGKNGSPDSTEDILKKIEGRLDLKTIQGVDDFQDRVVRHATEQSRGLLYAGLLENRSSNNSNNPALTLTTTGTSGAATYDSITGILNIPQYTSGGGSGTVTSVSIVTANGISGSVATDTTTPAITLTLGAITPTSVNSVVLSGSSTPTLAVTGTSTISGSNTGDQDLSGYALLSGTLAQFAATTSLQLKGVISDETGTGSLVFATSPTLVTPVLGVASATSINKLTITAPATGSTLTIDDGFTLHATGNVTALSGSHTGTSSGTNTGDQTSVSGNAGTATALQNARTIGGVSFDGTANITVATATGGFTVSGGNLALGTNSLTLTGSIAATGARVTKGWFTDLEISSMPTVGGTSLSSTFQPLDSDLTTIAGLTATTDNFIVSVASAWASRTPAQVRTTLGLVIGTNVQAWDADLDTWAGKTAPSGTVLGTTDTQTVTNKRNQPRITSAASYTTDTGTSLDVSTTDIFIVTAQAGALKFNNPSGTPVQGEKLIVRIKDNGTARALTYDTQFRASSDLALPTTTVLSKTLYMGFIYNFTDTKWDLLSVLNNI